MLTLLRRLAALLRIRRPRPWNEEHFVAAPADIGAIVSQCSDAVHTVNSHWFRDYAPGTVELVGVSATRSIRTVPGWVVKLRFIGALAIAPRFCRRSNFNEITLHFTVQPSPAQQPGGTS